MTIAHEEQLATIYAGDCVEVMAALEASSVDAIVTDPPYGLEFMGKAWDRGVPVAWIPEALRVLKPGGHLLAFGGSRTYHRLACAIEDAGFEVRDCLMWLYGSGFPKSLDVSKAIDKAAGAERPVVATREEHDITRPRGGGNERLMTSAGDRETRSVSVTAAATPEAAAWSGWGTALKPAHEPIVLARKPLAERNVAANVLAHGTGALNVDGCRIAFAGAADEAESKQKNRHVAFGSGARENKVYGADTRARGDYDPPGRWPANVLLSHADGCERVGMKRVKNAGGVPNAHSPKASAPAFTSAVKTSTVHHFDSDGMETVEAWTCVPDCPVRLLDEQSGELTTGGGQRNAPKQAGTFAANAGGASRFFYTTKADKEDRDGSKHPTIKPVDLMKWLIRLVTPPEGLVLDPFLGSGTTVYAARALGIRSIGIEKDPASVQDAIRRLRQSVLL